MEPKDIKEIMVALINNGKIINKGEKAADELIEIYKILVKGFTGRDIG